MGVFSTLGNHDYGDYAHWDSMKRKDCQPRTPQTNSCVKLGWRFLMNEHVVLEKNNEADRIDRN